MTMADSTTDTGSTPAAKQVQILLTTQEADTSLHVPPQPILVPLSLKRYGLSQIVNHLLSLPTPTAFDFLLDGKFLRTTLDEYLTQAGLSAESLLRIEYVRAIRPPLHLSSFEHDDWVSSVSVRGGDGKILSGGYDGISRVWDLSGNLLASAEGHTQGVKTVRWVSPDKFVSGGLDRTVKLWDYADEEIGKGSATLVADLLGHTGVVEDIAVVTGGKRILSAGGEGTVYMWSLDLGEAPTAVREVKSTKQQQAKRRKQVHSNVQAYKPVLTMSGHTGPAAGVIFDGKDSSVAYSVSWDHTIRTWDLVTGNLVDTRTTQHPLLCIQHIASLSLLACGSSATHITLHDPRSNEVATSLLKGHSNSVVGLVQSPDNEFLMASASHDGTVRLWDVRASGKGGDACVYTISRESKKGGKVFGVDWVSDVGIVSAGEDKRVQVNEGIK